MAAEKERRRRGGRRGFYDLEALEFSRVLPLFRPYMTSPLGLARLEASVPLASLEEIGTALGRLSEMKAFLEEGGRAPLTGFRDCRAWLESMASGGRLPNAKDMGELLVHLGALARVKKFLETHGGERPHLGSLGGLLPDLSDLREKMESIVDERGQVLDSASPRLVGIRADLAEAKARLDSVLRRLLRDKKITRWLQTTQVSWRGGRPVLQVKSEHVRRIPGILHDRSQSGQTAFVEPQEVTALANKLADARAGEEAEIRRILAELTRDVVLRKKEILESHEGLGLFDHVHGLARAALDWGLAVPQVTPDWPLVVQGARHPLLVKAAREEGGRRVVVPLDLELGGAFDCLVVTGPNTGGKTVALKCVGLLCLMALSGLPVFAETARVPFLDGVFADIGDEQEIVQNLSTFSAHMKRIVRILREATPRSLALLDELGAGTDPAEGGALGYAVLEELSRRGVKVLATTHLGVLKTFALHHPRAMNGAVEFDPATLKPLYRLHIGLPGTSNAIAIARATGIPEEVARQAESMLEKPQGGMEVLVEKLQEARLAAESHREKAREMERAAGERIRELEEKARALEERARALEREAEHRAESSLRKAREDLLELLKPLLQAPGTHGKRAQELKKALESLLDWSPLAEQRERFLRSLKRGDTVRVPRFRFRGPVEKVDRKKGKVLVLLEGGMRMEIPFQDVYPDETLPRSS